MFSERYVSMCKKFEGFENYWEPELGDVCVMNDEIVVIGDNFSKCYVKSHMDEVNWLPHLNQLYDIVGEMSGENWIGTYEIVNKFFKMVRGYFIDDDVFFARFKSREEIVISCIANMIGRSWDGGSWQNKTWENKMKYKGNCDWDALGNLLG